jgi:Fe-S cluster assembly protein SufD
VSARRSLEFPYAEQFGAVSDGLPGAALPWLAALRDDAAARLRRHGLPSARVEEWKYTSLTSLAETGFAPAAAPADGSTLPAVDHLGDMPVHRLVFVDGRLDAARSDLGSLPEGVTLLGLASALDAGESWLEDYLGRIAPLNGNALVSVNTAFAGDGCVLRLAPGAHLSDPVHVVSVASGASKATAFHPRLLVVVGENASATLVESHVGAADTAAYWTNPLAEISLGEGARLRHYRIQADGPQGFHLSAIRARLAAQSRYDNVLLSTGGALSRNEIQVDFDGPGSECRLSSGALMRGHQHADTTILVDHAHPECTSRQLFKSVLDDAARGVFQGKIVVRAGAQKTDGHQLSRTLLLSDQAEIDTKPELEIFADDVKCSHGATAGELDDEALFYFRSRGIDEERARHMLIEAFFDEVVALVEIEPLRDAMTRAVAVWLDADAQA